MIAPGTKVKLTHYEGTSQVEMWNVTVVESDNGLLKVEQKQNGGVKTLIFNMRSIGFHKVEMQD